MRLCTILIAGCSFAACAGLNLHLISSTVSSDGATTGWAPAPVESPEEDGA